MDELDAALDAAAERVTDKTSFIAFVAVLRADLEVELARPDRSARSALRSAAPSGAAPFAAQAGRWAMLGSERSAGLSVATSAEMRATATKNATVTRGDVTPSRKPVTSCPNGTGRKET